MMMIAAGVLALAAATAAAGPARVHGRAFPYGAPPGSTGGFGEPTCQLCHVGGNLNEAGGSLAVEGLPERYTPGETYRLIVRLRRGEMAAAGFQLSARTAAGAQAGTLAGTGTQAQVQATGGVQYAGHTEAGSSPGAPGAAQWTVQWTAPARGAGPVRIHVAANAADGDKSPIGDYVYALEKGVLPR
jgi:hypothetical protein